MARTISRRRVIASGAIAAGMMAGAGVEAQERSVSTSSGSARWRSWPWSRGPDPKAKRDLKPGPTPVRRACSGFGTRLWYPAGKGSITEAVKKIRDAGYTSAGAAHGPFRHNTWLDATDSELAELKAALKKYDVTFFDMMTYDNIIHPDREFR